MGGKIDGIKEKTFYQTLMQGQGIAFVWLAICLGCIGIIEKIWPEFFNYSYFGTVESLEGVILFYPLFIYAAIMCGYQSWNIKSSNLDEDNFVLGCITSVLAGIWEELGYRWIFICGSMIGIAFANWIFGTFIVWIFASMVIISGVITAVGGGKIKYRGKRTNNPLLRMMLAIILFIIGFGLFYIGTKVDPVYWFYDFLLIPIINLVTFFQFQSIFHGGYYTPLFLFGMIAVNFKFSDGHKYQGWKGQLNSWVIGLVMVYATLTYGLILAVVLHIIYDLEYDIIRYIFKKANRR